MSDTTNLPEGHSLEDQAQRPTFGGRPPVFESPEEMQEMISAYFNGGMRYRKIVTGSGDNRRVEWIPVVTITGLCLYLGFDSRQSFYDYEKKPEFSYTIKKARMFIESEYEEILATTGNAGAIFALKNFGWKDRSEIEMSGDFELTRTKIKDFLDDTNDDAYDADAGGSELTAGDEAESSGEVAEPSSDIPG